MNRLVKEIDRLLSKGMSNTCLKVTIEKKWRTQNFYFLSLKSLSSRSVFGELQLKQISLNFQTFCYNLKIKDLGEKLCVIFLSF